MLNGKRFKINTPAVSLDMVEGERVIVKIPAGEIVKVIADPGDGDRLVDVLWNGRSLTMFAIDLKLRGVELAEG